MSLNWCGGERRPRRRLGGDEGLKRNSRTKKARTGLGANADSARNAYIVRLSMEWISARRSAWLTPERRLNIAGADAPRAGRMRLYRRKNEGSRNPERASRRRSQESPPEPRKKPTAATSRTGGRPPPAGRRALGGGSVGGGRRSRGRSRGPPLAGADLDGTAEALGSLVLAGWRRAALPALRVSWRALKAGVAVGERTVTPARGLTIVALAATIVLGASQFRDYRAVQVGAPDYARVESVASAPEVDQARREPRTASRSSRSRSRACS